MLLSEKMIGAKSEWWRPRLYPFAPFYIYIVYETRRSLCALVGYGLRVRGIRKFRVFT